MITNPHHQYLELSWCDATLTRSTEDSSREAYHKADLSFLCGSGTHTFTELSAADLHRLGTSMLAMAEELRG